MQVQVNLNPSEASVKAPHLSHTTHVIWLTVCLSCGKLCDFSCVCAGAHLSKAPEQGSQHYAPGGEEEGGEDQGEEGEVPQEVLGGHHLGGEGGERR